MLRRIGRLGALQLLVRWLTTDGMMSALLVVTVNMLVRGGKFKPRHGGRLLLNVPAPGMDPCGRLPILLRSRAGSRVTLGDLTGTGTGAGTNSNALELSRKVEG